MSYKSMDYVVSGEFKAEGASWVEDATDWWAVNDRRMESMRGRWTEIDDDEMRLAEYAFDYLNRVYLDSVDTASYFGSIEEARAGYEDIALTGAAMLQAYNLFIWQQGIDDVLAPVVGEVILWDESDETLSRLMDCEIDDNRIAALEIVSGRSLGTETTGDEVLSQTTHARLASFRERVERYAEALAFAAPTV